MKNETTNGGDGGGLWDRVWDGIWRGRASSHRRTLANVAAEQARVTSLIVEISRVVDYLPEETRSVEVHGVCDEIVELTKSTLALVDHLRSVAGPIKHRRARPGILRRFERWLFGI